MVYTCMGLMAFYAGWQIWRMFLKLDSDKYPMRTFGDLRYRIYGTNTRHGMNILQSIQLLFNVGVIVIVNGQSLAQMAKYKICFSAAVIIWPVVGAIVGQIRKLSQFGYIASFSIWINFLVIIMCMAVAARTLPNYAVSFSTPAPVVHTIWNPPGSTFISEVNAAMQIVYAYGMYLYYSIIAKPC